MLKIVFYMPNMLVGGVEKSLLTLLPQLKAQLGDSAKIEIKFVEKVGGLLGDIPEYVECSQMTLPDDVRRQVAQIGTAAAIKKAVKKGRFLKAVSLYYKKRVKKIPSPELSFDFEGLTFDEGQYDIAVCYTTQNSFLIDYVARKVNAVHKIAWIHSSFFQSGYRIQNSKASLEMYDRIIGVAKQGVNEFCELLPTLALKTQVVYNYIDQNDIITKANVDCEVLKGKMKLMTVGRLGKEKGQDIAIDAARILKKQGIDFVWYFVGEGALRKYLEKKIAKFALAENCVLLGVKSNPYCYLRQCDLYVQPSRFEGFCITLAEAKVLGKAIVATNFVGAEEQLGGGLGVIVDTDASQLAKAISGLIQNEDLRLGYQAKLQMLKLDTNKTTIDFCKELVR